MAKILCFCASNSQKSINHDLLVAACELVEGHEKTYSALRDIDLPLYSLDIEAEEGYPEEIQAFYELIEAHDAPSITARRPPPARTSSTGAAATPTLKATNSLPTSPCCCFPPRRVKKAARATSPC